CATRRIGTRAATAPAPLVSGSRIRLILPMVRQECAGGVYYACTLKALPRRVTGKTIIVLPGDPRIAWSGLRWRTAEHVMRRVPQCTAAASCRARSPGFNKNLRLDGSRGYWELSGGRRSSLGRPRAFLDSLALFHGVLDILV